MSNHAPMTVNLVPKPTAESLNDPSKAGSPASEARTFGRNLRYRVQAYHTAGTDLEWLVEDPNVLNRETGKPNVVCACGSFEDAIAGLTHTAEVLVKMPSNGGPIYFIHPQGSRLQLDTATHLTREFAIKDQLVEEDPTYRPMEACSVLRRLLHHLLEHPNKFVRAMIERRVVVVQ